MYTIIVYTWINCSNYESNSKKQKQKQKNKTKNKNKPAVINMDL